MKLIQNFVWIFLMSFSRYAVFKVQLFGFDAVTMLNLFNTLTASTPYGLEWTRTTDLTLIRRAL